MMLLSALLVALASPGEADVVRLLSPRDAAPPCASVERGLADPVGALTAVAERYEGLPWVPIRAAVCLARHAEAQPALVRWAGEPDLGGLVVAALGALDRPGDDGARALELARAALAGPARAAVERTLARAELPELRALVR